MYIFRNILPFITSISYISLFVMFDMVSMLYVIVGRTTFSYNIFCILPSCLPTRILSPIIFISLTMQPLLLLIS